MSMNLDGSWNNNSLRIKKGLCFVGSQAQSHVCCVFILEGGDGGEVDKSGM